MLLRILLFLSFYVDALNGEQVSGEIPIDRELSNNSKFWLYDCKVLSVAKYLNAELFGTVKVELV